MTDQPITEIRPRRDSDLPSLARLLVEVHERDGYPVEGVADPEAWLKSDRLLGAWVAERAGTPVGHVVLTRPGTGDDAFRLWAEQSGASADGVAVLGRLFVSSSARGQHLGRRLTTTATQEANRLGRRPVLDVMAKDVAAIRTYEVLGWTCLGQFCHRFAGGRTEPALAYVSAT